MDRNNPWFDQVALLVDLIPLVSEEQCFALKGGTAINLFIRDMPRFSVDIDLVYLPDAGRQQADWNKVGLGGSEQLPAIRWKQRNLAQMSEEKRAYSLEKLRNVLNL